MYANNKGLLFVLNVLDIDFWNSLHTSHNQNDDIDQMNDEIKWRDQMMRLTWYQIDKISGIINTYFIPVSLIYYINSYI